MKVSHNHHHRQFCDTFQISLIFHETIIYFATLIVLMALPVDIRLPKRKNLLQTLPLFQ